jgi:hypothetical protein
MEHAMIEGALDATRKDNGRLHREVATLRSILRLGMALDDAPVAPDEPADDEASVKAKAAGKSAESA